MDAKKVTIIVLVVVAIAFTLILLFGWGGRDESAGLEPPTSIDFLKSVFVKGRSVRSAELSPRELITSPSEQPKEFTIEPAEDVRVRSMKLEMIQGLEMELELVPAGDEDDRVGLPVSLKLKSSLRTTPKLQVFKDGAILKVKCVRPDLTLPVCRLKLI